MEENKTIEMENEVISELEELAAQEDLEVTPMMPESSGSGIGTVIKVAVGAAAVGGLLYVGIKKGTKKLKEWKDHRKEKKNTEDSAEQSEPKWRDQTLDEVEKVDGVVED